MLGEDEVINLMTQVIEVLKKFQTVRVIQLIIDK